MLFIASLEARVEAAAVGVALLLGQAARVRGGVDRAEVLPGRRDRVRGRDAGDGLSEDHRETRLEVEVDVAVEEPRARVVGAEADRDVVVVGRSARRDDIAPDGVLVVVGRRACRANDREGVLER